MNSIPIIGTAVVNSTSWVTRLINSVDYPVENFFIVNNNGRGDLDYELDKLKAIEHRFIKKIHISHMPANIGCSGAWNLIIKCFMKSPYWIIVNDDVAFGDGFLEEMHQTAEQNPTVGLIHGNPGDFQLGSWDLFLIRDIIVEQFGLFDENLYPAYCEDVDYIMRMIHRPIQKIVSLNKKYYHGNGDSTEYYICGSQTSKTDPSLSDKLDVANQKNIEYLNHKWGAGWRTCSPSNYPFSGEESAISSTRYDLRFLREKHLGF